MKKKLKTLKDLMGNAQAPYPMDWCLRMELKQELGINYINVAERLIKQIHKLDLHGLKKIRYQIAIREAEAQIFILKKIFNLSKGEQK